MADEPAPLQNDYTPAERAEDMRMACIRAAIDTNALAQCPLDTAKLLADAERILSFVTGEEK